MGVESTSILKLLITFIIVLVGVVIYYIINIGNTYLEDDKQIKFNFKKIIPFISIILALILYGLIAKKYSIVSDTVGTVIVSIVLAYLFNPIVNHLEEKGLSRKLGILLIYLAIVALIFILSFLVIPRTIKEVKRLFNVLPYYLDVWVEQIEGIYNKYIVRPNNIPDIFKGIQDVIMENVNKLQKTAFNSITGLFNGVISLFSKFISLVLIPILTFYFINDKEYFLDRAKKVIPKKSRDEIIDLLKEIDKSLNSFVRGRLMLALYVGVATTILLLILKVEFAVVIGFITGIADIVPYIGPFLGFLPAVFFAFLSSPTKAIWVSIIFLLIQWVENNVLAPKVIGDSTGIHPMMILLGLILGGGMFGVIGMVFSVPFIAVFKILIRFIYSKIKESKIFNN